jgi:hypothetical protein
MRDFNNGGDMNVNGDLFINDNSQNKIGDLLINCTSEALRQELPFRQENLQIERTKKIKKTIPFLAFAVMLIIAAAAWAQINGKSDFVAFALGIGAILVTFSTIRGVIEPTEFEVQEKSAIREIKLILKTRRED